MKTHSYRQRAFTLIEMLVVIAIIALLAALITPVISKAMKSAKRTKAASNLHQTGIAMMNYRLDHNDEVVPSADLRGSDEQWYILLSPYASGQARNANDTEILEVFWDPIWDPGTTDSGNPITWFTGFAFNAKPARPDSGRWNKIRPGQDNFDPFFHSNLTYPSLRVAVAPSTHYMMWADGDEVDSLRNVDVKRYDKNPPYLMFDGSVRGLRPEKAAKALYNPGDS